MWIMSEPNQREDNTSISTNQSLDDGIKLKSLTSNPNSSRLFQCLTALDQDIQRLSKISIDNKNKNNLQLVESINNSHIGLYYRVRENIFISYYCSPSQENQLHSRIEKNEIDSDYCLNRILESLTEQYSFTVRNSQSHNTLQIQPILNKGSLLSFANVDGIKGISLDAEFVIILKQYTPIQLSVIKDIEKITELPVIKHTLNDLKEACREDNLAEDFLKLVFFKYNQLGLENLDNYLVFKDIGMEHVYKKASSSNVKGFLVKEIPFSSPAQLVEVINLLRKQARFTSLLSTFVIHDGIKSNINYSLKRIEIQYRLLDFFSFQLHFTHVEKSIKIIFNEDKKKIHLISNLSENVDTARIEKLLRITNAIPIVLTAVLKATKLHSLDKINELNIKSNNINAIKMENRLLENLAKARMSVELQKSNESAGLLAGGQAFRCLISPKELNSPQIIDQLSTMHKTESRYSILNEHPRVTSKLDDLLSVSNTDYSSLESLDTSSSRSTNFSPLIARYFKAFNEPFKDSRKKSTYADQYTTSHGINNKPGLSSSTSLSQLFATVGGLISQSPVSYQPPTQSQPIQNETKPSESIVTSRISSSSSNPSSSSYENSNTSQSIHSDQQHLKKPGYNNSVSSSSSVPANKIYDQGTGIDGSYSYSNPSSTSNSNPPGSMLISLLNEEMPKNSNQSNNNNTNEIYTETSSISNKTRSPCDMDVHNRQQLPNASINTTGSHHDAEVNYSIANRYPNQQGKFKKTSTTSPQPQSFQQHHGPPTTSIAFPQDNLSPPQQQHPHQQQTNFPQYLPHHQPQQQQQQQHNHNQMPLPPSIKSGGNKRPSFSNNNPQQHHTSSSFPIQQMNSNNNNKSVVTGSFTDSISGPSSNLSNHTNNAMMMGNSPALTKSLSSSSVYDFDDNHGNTGLKSKKVPGGKEEFSISNKVLLGQNKLETTRPTNDSDQGPNASQITSSIKLKIKGVSNTQLSFNNKGQQPQLLSQHLPQPSPNHQKMSDQQQAPPSTQQHPLNPGGLMNYSGPGNVIPPAQPITGSVNSVEKMPNSNNNLDGNRLGGPPMMGVQSKTVVSGKPAAEVMRKIQEPSSSSSSSFGNNTANSMTLSQGPPPSGSGGLMMSSHGGKPSGIIRKNKIIDSSGGEQPKPKKKPKVVHPGGMTTSQMRAAEGRKPLGRPPGSKNSGSKLTKASSVNKLTSDPISQMGNFISSGPAGMLPNGPNIPGNHFNSNPMNGQNVTGGNNNTPGLIGNAMNLFNLSSGSNGYKIPKLKSTTKSSSNPNLNGPEMNQNHLTGTHEANSNPMKMANMMNVVGQGGPPPGSHVDQMQKKSKLGIDDIMMSQLRNNNQPSADSQKGSTIQKPLVQQESKGPATYQNHDTPSSAVVPNQGLVNSKPKSHKVDTDTPASPTPESPLAFSQPLGSNQGGNSISIPTYRHPSGNGNNNVNPAIPPPTGMNNSKSIRNFPPHAGAGNIGPNPIVGAVDQRGHQRMNPYQQKPTTNKNPNNTSSGFNSYQSYEQLG